MIPVYVLTNEKHYWLLPGFHYLADTFWADQEITTVGYPEPSERYLSPFFVCFFPFIPNLIKRWKKAIWAWIFILLIIVLGHLVIQSMGYKRGKVMDMNDIRPMLSQQFANLLARRKAVYPGKERTHLTQQHLRNLSTGAFKADHLMAIINQKLLLGRNNSFFAAKDTVRIMNYTYFHDLAISILLSISRTQIIPSHRFGEIPDEMHSTRYGNNGFLLGNL